jgi:hypothetical protein
VAAPGVPAAAPALAPARARLAAPAAAPAAGAARGPYRLAVLDMPAPRERAQAAGVVVAAVREAAAADERLDVVPDKLVEQARVVWGGRDVLVLSEHGIGSGMDDAAGNADMARTQACAIGHAAGAAWLLLVSGYEMELGQATGNAEVRLAGTLAVINVRTCKVRERAVARATGTGASAAEALAGARAALARAAHERLRGLLPLHSAVRAVRGRGGAMRHGARDGVQPGQYFDVRRDARVVGQVYVDDVAEDGAEVSLVRGVASLQAGDRLVERKPVRVFEVGLTATPGVLDRVDARDIVRVATAVHGTLYRPVGSNMYGGSLERMSAKDFSRWRVGVHFGRQVRIVPRRLFAYARLGAGLLWARQAVREGPPFDTFYGGAHLRGFELTPAIGARYLLGDGLVVQLAASMPIPLYHDTWYLDWDAKWTAPAEVLYYASPQRLLPTVSLGAGWTF